MEAIEKPVGRLAIHLVAPKVRPFVAFRIVPKNF
jgi:hypothetical protein